MKELWTEKYRPDTLDGYVFKDLTQRDQIEAWIKSKTIPHLLFSGAPGVGKTTLAKILINSLGINEYDVLEINASRENSVDTIRDKITNFVSTMPFGIFKVVLLDEADYITPNGQAALRGVMETYHASARFILTCNYPNKVIPALHSRCQGFHIERVDLTEFTARVATVLVTEEVEFDLDNLDSYVKAGRINEARKLMCTSVRPEEMEDVFRWMYDNLDLWGSSDEQQDRAILVIRQGLVNVSFVADQEINLSATLVELCQIN
jgi:replication factor C small subunit